MALVTPTLAVRSRVEPGPEAPFDLLHDPLGADLVAGGAFARRRFATLWSDTAALADLARAKRSALDPALATALLEYHKRLGAPAASLASIEKLARGEAVCTVAGQQPAPLGGPLYSMYKTASAIGWCPLVEARTGIPCVPLFWMHGEDSDFAEIRGATIADAELKLVDLALPDDAHRDGGLVGSIETAPMAALEREALSTWERHAGRGEVAALLERAAAGARDQGEAYSALMLALFGARGLIVIDPRLPAFRNAARPIIERYLTRAEAVSEAARRAGDEVERAYARRPLTDQALESFVFGVTDGVRTKLSVDEARRAGASQTLSPSVALRPVVQDGVFPTVAMACGSGEIGYLAQLREVFEGVDVRPACVVPRLSMTWLPPPAVELLESAGVEPWDLVAHTDVVLRGLAERSVPDDVRGELERAREAAQASFERFAVKSKQVDPSLPQMVDSARGKVDFQYQRLLDGVVGKARHRIERQHPEWLRVRYYLLPSDRLQERRIAGLESVAYRGARVAGELCDLAEEQGRRLEQGVREHLVLDL